MGILAATYQVINIKDTKQFCKQCNLSFIIFVVFFAFILVINNYIMNKAFKVSPNIGYSHMIINLNVILLLAGYFIFKQNVNVKSLIGILIALFGVFIIVKRHNIIYNIYIYIYIYIIILLYIIWKAG